MKRKIRNLVIYVRRLCCPKKKKKQKINMKGMEGQEGHCPIDGRPVFLFLFFGKFILGSTS